MIIDYDDPSMNVDYDQSMNVDGDFYDGGNNDGDLHGGFDNEEHSDHVDSDFNPEEQEPVNSGSENERDDDDESIHSDDLDRVTGECTHGAMYVCLNTRNRYAK
jgi:hypothetical protein